MIKKRIEDYRKKAIKDGGEIVITERKTQGAARLSALHDSYNTIVSQFERCIKTQFQCAENTDFDKLRKLQTTILYNAKEVSSSKKQH